MRCVHAVGMAGRRSGAAARTPAEMSWNVMFGHVRRRKCHVLSCRPFPPGCRRGPPTRLRRGLRRRRSVAVIGASFQAKQRAGRGVPVSRAFAGARVRGRGRAYRGGAVRARDCPRETAGAPRPSVPAGVFFAAPSQSLSAEKPKGGPGSRLSLLSFYTIWGKVKSFREQKMKMSEIFHGMPVETRAGATVERYPS